jgi:uncharacterized protein (TIGR02001 family)
MNCGKSSDSGRRHSSTVTFLGRSAHGLSTGLRKTGTDQTTIFRHCGHTCLRGTRLERVIPPCHNAAPIKIPPETVWEKVSGLTDSFRHCSCLMILAALIAAPASAARAGSWGGSVGAATAYLFHGLSLSSNSASAQADAYYHAASGWFGGVGGAGVRFGSYYDETVQLNAYLGKDWAFGDDWGARLTATRYQLLDIAPHPHYNYDALAGVLSFRDSLYLSASVLPDLSADSTRGSAHHKPALSADAAFHEPLWRRLSANAGVGYFDLQRLFGTGYVYGSAGLGCDFGPLHLDVAYVATNSTAKNLYEEMASNRWTAALLYRF